MCAQVSVVAETPDVSIVTGDRKCTIPSEAVVAPNVAAANPRARRRATPLRLNDVTSLYITVDRSGHNPPITPYRLDESLNVSKDTS